MGGFATGKGSAKIFRQHFDGWLTRGKFCVAPNAESRAVFSTGAKAVASLPGGIELCVMASVSPACTVPYKEKRSQWFKHCFTTGRSTLLPSALKRQGSSVTKSARLPA